MGGVGVWPREAGSVSDSDTWGGTQRCGCCKTRSFGRPEHCDDRKVLSHCLPALSTSRSPGSQDPPLCHPMLASHLVLHSCRDPICTEHSGTPVPGVQELFLGVHCERAPWGLWDKAGSTERPSDP